MKTKIILASLVFIATAATAQADKVCPSLPGEEFTWTHKKGPDFDICYAKPSGSKETAFGVYLGNAPGFNPQKGTAIDGGEVGGYVVTWYQVPKEPGTTEFARQTIVYLSGKQGLLAHVWLNAATSDQLAQRLAALKKLQFK